MIYWCLFIISVMSISRLVRLFMIVLYLLKPVSIIHYLEHVSDNFWLFYYCLCFTYIQMHIFHLNSLFLIFCICLSYLFWCSIFWCCRCRVVTYHVLDLRCSLCIHCNIAYHIVLQILFCISYDIICISMTCMHISIYMLVCEHDIFINMFNIFFNFLHISQWIFSHICIVYKVFKWLFSTWCIIFCHSSFQCCISCFLCNCHGWWWYYK